jgi:hypothetical protein
VDPQTGRVFVGSSAGVGLNRGGVASFNFRVYDAGLDTPIYDGGNGYQIVGGEPGENSGLYYFDQDCSGDYTVGEDIWNDVGDQSGVYDAGDALNYDGGDGLQVSIGKKGIQSGLYYYDADGGVPGYALGYDIWKEGARFAVSFDGMEHLNLTTGGGSDTIHLVASPTDDLETAIPTTITTGEGDDSVLLSQFAGTITVDTGGGADAIDIRIGTPGAILTVGAGEGNDDITLAGTASGSTTTINAGAGDDFIEVSGARMLSEATFNGDSDTDTLRFIAFGEIADPADVQPPDGFVAALGQSPLYF